MSADDLRDETKFTPARDAREVGCTALLGGCAWSISSGKRVHAWEVSKEDGPFVCLGCGSDVIHRRPWHMRTHFAHHARLSPLDSSRESKLHARCKREIFNALQTRYPEARWICDSFRIPGSKRHGRSARKPDIGGRIRGQRVVIEIQKSAIGIRNLIARTRDYNSLGIAILWVVPLTSELGTKLFRPRLIERYLHSLYFGRVYYWLPGMRDTVMPIHFSPAVRAVPVRSNESGHWEDAGLINRPYKIIRRPNSFGEPIPIGEAFNRRHRQPFLPWGETRALPEASLWLDRLRPWWPRYERSRFIRDYPEVDDTEEEGW